MSGGDANRALLDILIYWFTAFVSSLLTHPIGAPPLLLYLILGALLGNFGVVEHTAETIFFSEWAITIVFFSLGLEETVEHFVDGIRKAWGIALIGAAAPFGTGYLCAFLIWRDEGWFVHLVIATAVTATAVSLTMVVLQSVGLLKSRAAVGIMTAAVLDDVGCLILVAVLMPIAISANPNQSHEQGSLSVVGILWIVAKVVIFFTIVIFLHKIVLPHDAKEGLLSYIPLCRTYGAKHLLSTCDGSQVPLAVVTFGLALGVVGMELGFHPAVGGYFAGLILDEKYFDIDPKQDPPLQLAASPQRDAPNPPRSPPSAPNATPHIDNQPFQFGFAPFGDETEISGSQIQPTTEGQRIQFFQDLQSALLEEQQNEEMRQKRNTMEHAKDAVATAAFMWLGPMFFVFLGSGLEVHLSMLGTAVLQASIIAVALYIAQFLSAGLAARYVPGGFSWSESALIGFGCLGRAELYFVVLEQAFEEKIIRNEIFFPMAMAAMLLNVSLPISIALFKPFYLGHAETVEPTPRVPSPVPSIRPSRAPSVIVRRGIGLAGVQADPYDNMPTPRVTSRLPSPTATSASRTISRIQSRVASRRPSQLERRTMDEEHFFLPLPTFATQPANPREPE